MDLLWSIMIYCIAFASTHINTMTVRIRSSALEAAVITTATRWPSSTQAHAKGGASGQEHTAEFNIQHPSNIKERCWVGTLNKTNYFF